MADFTQTTTPFFPTIPKKMSYETRLKLAIEAQAESWEGNHILVNGIELAPQDLYIFDEQGCVQDLYTFKEAERIEKLLIKCGYRFPTKEEWEYMLYAVDIDRKNALLYKIISFGGRLPSKKAWHHLATEFNGIHNVLTMLDLDTHHLPTDKEWEQVINTFNPGEKIREKLKLELAGYCIDSHAYPVKDKGSKGYYWITPQRTKETAYCLALNNGCAMINHSGKNFCYRIRCCAN